MSEKEFLSQLVEMMDTEADLSMNTDLADVEEWDSLSYIAFMVFISEVKGISVKPEIVKKAAKVKDLYEIISGDKK